MNIISRFFSNIGINNRIESKNKKIERNKKKSKKRIIDKRTPTERDEVTYFSVSMMLVSIDLRSKS